MIITFREAVNLGIWDKIIELKNYDPYCGHRMSDDDTIELSPKEFIILTRDN
jgi:hypothetical protein